MAAIPRDILDVIDRVDRAQRADLLPKADTPLTKYDSGLEATFPRFQVVNLTEFDYGRSYRYSIVMSQDPDAAALDKERLNRAVRREGEIGLINLAISVFIPLVQVKFVRYFAQAEKIAQEWSDNPFFEAQARSSETLLNFLGRQGIRRIDPGVAAIVVPDVETDLHDLGEMTVADCLFHG